MATVLVLESGQTGAKTSGRQRRDETVSRKSSREDLSEHASCDAPWDPAKALVMSSNTGSRAAFALDCSSLQRPKSLGTDTWLISLIYILDITDLTKYPAKAWEPTSCCTVRRYDPKYDDATQDLDDAIQDSGMSISPAFYSQPHLRSIFISSFSYLPQTSNLLPASKYNIQPTPYFGAIFAGVFCSVNAPPASRSQELGGRGCG